MGNMDGMNHIVDAADRDGGAYLARPRRRLKLVVMMVMVIWLALIARLFYIQILSHESLSAAATSQYQVLVEGLDTRGMILDRNYVPLTGGTDQYYYFLPARRLDSGSARLLGAISAKCVSAPPAVSDRADSAGGMAGGDDGGGADSRRGYCVYRSQMFDSLVNTKLKEEYGAYVFSCPARYRDSQIACHLIGYLNQSEKRGVSGLELACESELKAGKGKLSLWADSGGNLLLGLSPRQEGQTELASAGVITTLDTGIQKRCEAALAMEGLGGAVMVSEASSGQVLGWASSPIFNPNTVDAYLSDSGDCLVDKCIQGAYSPGSVFKVVVAAAALESGKWDPEKKYDCRGETTVQGVELGCQSGPEGGHGKVDLYEAMTKSCNCYFAHLGDELGYEAVLDMAEQMGFGRIVFGDTGFGDTRFDGIGFAEEIRGNLPDEGETGQWDISNLSIGQGAILATPAQVQRMMAVVANDGVMMPLHVLQRGSIIDGGADDGGHGEGAAACAGRRILSEGTAAALQVMLRGVMTEGTGSGTDLGCPVYGKTGTAEAVSGGEAVNNCWFSGFCRIGDKNYVITVLAERGLSGSASALPVFQDICEYMEMRNFSM